MKDLEYERVLSIQSHVVSGYVGNRAATFPLQTLGYDVDVINTVQFSNHTGYRHTNGHKTTSEQLEAIFEGLTSNNLLGYGRALTGYIPGADALKVVAQEIAKMKMTNPNMIYLLDPVMGDVGRGLYVSKDVLSIYTDMLRLATIITPNHFEIELLAQTTITSLSTLHSAFQRVHRDHGVPHIVLSSITLPASMLSTLKLPGPPPSYTCLISDHMEISSPSDTILVCFASTLNQTATETWAWALPNIEGYFTGTGDLFSSLVLGHFQRGSPPPSDPPPLIHAVSKALLTVQQILLRTHLHSQSGSQHLKQRPSALSATDVHGASAVDDLEENSSSQRRLRELRIIPERQLIANESDDGWPGVKLDWSK